MRHIPDGMLRRLEDEPLAVPDRVNDHLDSCKRCCARRADITHNRRQAADLLCAPALAPDLDVAWARIQRELDRPIDAPARRGARVRRRRRRLPRLSLRSGLAIGALSSLIAGTAAAATLTTIFAPTHVAPVSLSQTDLRAIAAFTGVDDSHSFGGFTTPNGSSRLRFGTVTWSSGSARPVTSRAQAAAQANFPVTLPAHLPSGVGDVARFFVTPRLTATVTFDSRAARLAGSSVTMHAGPAVVAQYSSTARSDMPTLAVMAMRRPTAQSTGASMSQIRAFLLTQPGIPPALAEEVRLLGDLSATLPVPVPSGAAVRSVRVDGWPGVLVGDTTDAAAGVVWEDGKGVLHAVAGLVDSHDVLDVAKQLS